MVFHKYTYRSTGRSTRCGLILTEALFAVAILMIAGIVMGSIINNAVTATATSKNYLIGQNLATEAVEAVKNIRDTNWMTHPVPEEGEEMSWLCLQPSEDCTGGAGEIPNVGFNYILAQDAAERWYLQVPDDNANVILNLDGPNPQQQAQYKLFLVEKNADGYRRYTRDLNGGTIIESNPDFYRSVRFNVVDAETASYEVRVQWRDGSKVRKIARIINLYNYQDE